MAKWLITSFDLNWEDNNSAPTRSTNDGPAPSQGATDRFINSPIRKNNFFDTLTDSFDSPQHFLFHSPPCVEDIVINFAEWNIFDQTGFVCDILQKPRHVGKDDQFLGFQRRSQNCGSSISVNIDSLPLIANRGRAQNRCVSMLQQQLNQIQINPFNPPSMVTTENFPFPILNNGYS